MVFSSIKSKKAALLLVLGLVALAAGSAQAGVYTWTGDETATGNSYADWGYGNNWGGAAPTFVNTDDIKIAGTTTLDQYIRGHRTIRSLEFTSSNTGATQIGFIAANGADRDLTFSAGTGTNSTLTVDASATGNKTLGSFEGSTTPGELVLLSNLDVTHNGTGNLIFASEIRGPGDLNVAGSGLTVFSGINIYTGNTTVDGALTLSDDAQLVFTIGTNGVNNTLSGSGSVTLDGDFLLDLTGAGTTLGDSWEIVDVNTLTETFDATFSLASTAGSFTETNGVWSISENGVVYEFAENTGLLTVANILPAAHWMSGEMGVGWRFRADDKTQIDNWDVATLVAQVKTIPNVNHVIFNLSDAAHGDAYIAPHSVLSVITPESTPNGGLGGRDLFLEMATAFQAEGIKVIAYVATQGPAMLKHGAEQAFDSVEVSPGVFTSQAMDNWSNYVYSVYNIADFSDEREMYKRAFGEVILDEYAARYGSLIDGWWFDNGAVENFDAESVYSIAKQYNPKCAVSTSSSDTTLYGDYLGGHPAALATYGGANHFINLPKLNAIETSPAGYFYEGTHPNLGHMFMALGTAWNGGPIVWELDQAADWMTRCLNAGGAWTWNVDLSDNDSMIRVDSATFITDVDGTVSDNVASNLFSPVFSQDTYNELTPGGGVVYTAEVGAAYIGSVTNWATDADGDTLTYGVIGPDWLTVNTNDHVTLQGTPYSTFDLGTNHFTLVASDGRGRIDLAELEIYVTDEFGSGIPHTHVSFDNLRGNLSDGSIEGLPIGAPNVTITKATNGNDVVLSLAILNQDFDGDDDFDDSLSWDVRVKGFSGGTVTVNGTNSSVSLGTNVFVGTTNNEFGVSGVDLRFLNPGESIQFSVENVSLSVSAEPNATVQFDGFDGIFGTSGTYIPGTGTGLESMIIASNMNVSLPSPTVLTLTAATEDERLRDVDGGFTIYPEGVNPDNAPPTINDPINKPDATEGVAYSGTIAGEGSDVDVGDTLTYSLVSASTWLNVATNGALTGTPLNAHVGSNTFTVSVSDGIADPVEATLNITVNAVVPSASFATWIAGFGLSGDDLLEGTDVEPDGLDNLQEYALGGNPTNDDASAILPDGYVAEDAGTDYLYYVHNERTDDSALVYTVGTKTNLVTDTVLNTNDVSYVNESGEVDSIKSVTNRTAATEAAKFIQLEVQKN
jgi:hypothetical protein